MKELNDKMGTERAIALNSAAIDKIVPLNTPKLTFSNRDEAKIQSPSKSKEITIPNDWSNRLISRYCKLAIANMLSNLMVPLSGMITVAFLGHLQDIRYLAGVELATVLFNDLRTYALEHKTRWANAIRPYQFIRKSLL